MNEDKSELQKCEEHFKSRMEDIKVLNEIRLLEDFDECPLILEKIKDEYGEPSEYGLSFDFVEAGTFTDQRAEFVRFQISWGGPQEEFRFYVNGDVEFWFLNWGTGEHKNLNQDQKDEVMQYLGGCDYAELKMLAGGD